MCDHLWVRKSFFYLLCNSFRGYTYIYIWTHKMSLGNKIAKIYIYTEIVKGKKEHKWWKTGGDLLKQTLNMRKTNSPIIQWEVILYKNVCLPSVTSLFSISNSKIYNYLYVLINTWHLLLHVQTSIIWMYLRKRL